MSDGTTTNSCWENQLAQVRRRMHQRQFWQDIAAPQVAPDGLEKNAGKNDESLRQSSAKLCASNELQGSAACASHSILCNSLAAKDLHEFAEKKCEENRAQKREHWITPSKFVRFSKFNFVGGIGIVVQFAALVLLKSVFRCNYLVATALAVEIAVLHNFIWHERFTWVDRTKRGLSQNLRGPTVARLVRFHLGNGAVSIVGNVALMKVIVDVGHMNYLVANAIAIALCSLVNFLVSDTWVFEE